MSETAPSLSVVIPTVGRACIKSTLSVIETWAVCPREIVVALPNDSLFDLSSISTTLKLVEVRSHRGQVNQRLAGFRYASSEFVLQLDDDILIDSPSIILLLEAINICNSCAVAPSLYKYPESVPWDTLPRDIVSRSRHWVLRKILGAKSRLSFMGTISQAGVPFAVDPTFIQGESIDVDWVPGGVLLHRRENLILDQFFPFEGRASHEDLFHSFLLRRKGVRIMILRSSLAYHPSPPLGIEPWSMVIHGLKIHLAFVSRFGFSRKRFFIWAIYSIFSHSMRRLLN